MISRTDSLPSNLGHTFAHLEEIADKAELTKEEIDHLSSSRHFLNQGADFVFEEGLQFTVEPQLLSLNDASFPKVTHHFVVKKREDGFIVCNDIDELLEEFELK